MSNDYNVKILSIRRLNENIYLEDKGNTNDCLSDIVDRSRVNSVSLILFIFLSLSRLFIIPIIRHYLISRLEHARYQWTGNAY